MKRLPILAVILLTTIGCQNDSDRIANMATQHANQQAELSRETVELQTVLVGGTQQLVGADAQARRDFLELEAKLDEHRATIDRRQDELAEARLELAKQQARDPIVANAVLSVGTILTCMLPLLFAGYILRSNFHQSDDEVASELLLDEIVAIQQSRVALRRVDEEPGADRCAGRSTGDTRLID